MSHRPGRGTGQPLVSVLIPACNAERYVTAALGSVLAQDVADLEVVVVDDGSADATADVVRALGDPRIRVVSQDSSGIVSALNNGLDHVRGHFIARLDADDLMGIGRLRAQLTAMAADPDLVVCGSDYSLFDDGSAAPARRRPRRGSVVRMPRTDRACRLRLAMASCHPSSGVMIRASALTRSGARFREDFRHAEDYRMWCELSEWGTLANLPMIGLHYRLHPHQVSVTYAQRQRELHVVIARRYAARAGLRPLPPTTIRSLLFPEIDGSGGLGGALRQGASMLIPWATATARNPGVETARFAGRRVYEAMAQARSLPR